MTPPHLTLNEPTRSNGPTYTLDIVRHNRSDGSSEEHNDRSSLLTPTTPNYGATFPLSPTRTSSRKIVVNATLKMACIFLLSTITLSTILWLALPTLDEDDRPLLRIPKSFTQLQDLNGLLKKYRGIYPYRIFVCYVTTYLFLQAFSLPGSMYLSILGGAVWGVPRALPLACCCVATGATLCYLISAALGPALLALPKWKARLDQWAKRIQDNKENLISFLIVLRIAPLPPHWMVNIICPHVGIGIVPFWISTALGIFGVSVIHTTIGGGLDDMTSADDFHLISWRNFFGLAAIVVGVLVPVGLRYWFRAQVNATIIEDDVEEEVRDSLENGETLPNGDRVLAVGRPIDRYNTKGLAGSRIILRDEDEDEFDFEDDDEDVILEAGPSIPLVGKANPKDGGNDTAAGSRR